MEKLDLQKGVVKNILSNVFLNEIRKAKKFSFSYSIIVYYEVLYNTGWSKINCTFCYTVNLAPDIQFRRSIVPFEGHLMPFKMRYKAMYKYNHIKFYELNRFCCHMDSTGWR
jgi:hypothetical protein